MSEASENICHETIMNMAKEIKKLRTEIELLKELLREALGCLDYHIMDRDGPKDLEKRIRDALDKP